MVSPTGAKVLITGLSLLSSDGGDIAPNGEADKQGVDGGSREHTCSEHEENEKNNPFRPSYLCSL